MIGVYKKVIDLPPNIPEPTPAPMEVVSQCVGFVSDYFNIPDIAIKAIMEVEGGKMCTLSKNSNGSYDMGIMQINTIHYPSIVEQYPSLKIEDIACKPCLNITLGAWILSKRIKEADDLWKGVGNYHSKTPKYHKKYLEKIEKSVKNLTMNKS